MTSQPSATTLSLFVEMGSRQLFTWIGLEFGLLEQLGLQACKLTSFVIFVSHYIVQGTMYVGESKSNKKMLSVWVG
jgi:hypothetical protein